MDGVIFALPLLQIFLKFYKNMEKIFIGVISFYIKSYDLDSHSMFKWQDDCVCYRWYTAFLYFVFRFKRKLLFLLKNLYNYYP
ncbi:hypothetical protein DID78_05240 [Candidatus Marinamargulisbacteria bacterium SCGC AG-343-D04]|nr:hypothetical protein DID78_05240 [Candidatus Marinamargulisbacteria bacterium SCGC AG-343-D04]